MNSTKEFYQIFTYPFSEVKKECSVGGEGILLIYDRLAKQNKLRGKRILDAGCGTGQRVIDIAKYFREACIVGVDFSENSINIAKKQALQDKVTNIEFICGDLLTYVSPYKFDIINMYGVLHHIKDAEIVLKKLLGDLNETGIFVAWCYHKYGEYNRMLNRELLMTLLGGKGYSAGVELMNELEMSISENRYGNSYGDHLNKADCICKDADAFLNPYVRTYDFEELMLLVKTSGFDWFVVEQINYENQGYILNLEDDSNFPFWMFNPKNYLKSDKAYEYYRQLNKIDRLHVIELLVKPTGFTIFAGKKAAIGTMPERIRKNMIFFNE